MGAFKARADEKLEIGKNHVATMDCFKRHEKATNGVPKDSPLRGDERCGWEFGNMKHLATGSKTAIAFPATPASRTTDVTRASKSVLQPGKGSSVGTDGLIKAVAVPLRNFQIHSFRRKIRQDVPKNLGTRRVPRWQECNQIFGNLDRSTTVQFLRQEEWGKDGLSEQSWNILRTRPPNFVK
ncbi:hypothetical protein M7I_8191 [Glarea lozoyensis 74030]|uniref:Uncharacterized protein n=1 Tax=Glarea lozoyensis (strain ATCC 74030 / MF5533) TaxID=1104152 RepID=H0EZC8_GLAL7|nr:hypothetical protein M7I_8191 [Glarea lozoyensis 74030]